LRKEEMDSRDLIQYTLLSSCQTHLSLANLEPVLKSIEQRPIGFFQAYDSENLMDMDALKSFVQTNRNGSDFPGDEKFELGNHKCKTRDLNQTNPQSVVGGDDKPYKSFKHSFAMFQNDTDDFSVECSPEVEEMKLNVFGEIIEEILQESLSDFLEGEKQVTEASLKEYYRGIFGSVDKKKNTTELMAVASSEYMNFRKLFKRFIG